MKKLHLELFSCRYLHLCGVYRNPQSYAYVQGRHEFNLRDKTF